MSTRERTPAEILATPVQYLKGVGPQRAELLGRLGLRTAADVLFFFPRDYQDLTDLRDIEDLEEDKLQSVCGVVEDVELRGTSTPGRSVLGVLVRRGTGYLRAVWFNQPFMRDQFDYGQRVMFSGKPKHRGLVWEMHHPKVQHLAEDEEEPEGKILPVYPLTEGLQQWQLRRITRGVLDGCAELLGEAFPESYLKQHDLWPIRRAIEEIHFPGSHEGLAKARRRFVYQELFVLQLALALKRRQQHDQRRAPALEATAQIDARIRRLFPFELTAAQQQAIAEIAADMAVPLPVAHGHQAVLMAPTEVLARQHALTLNQWLAASQVRRALLTGGLTSAKRTALLEQIAAGEIDVVVGTQAVIQQDVRFAKLGLVVIDEQHKFGVRQRATLKYAGLDPHYLVMTATPIPRTVTMTLFGDLDVSTLRESPPGRQPVGTYLAGEEKRAKWWDFFREKLREGRQGYVVTPLVEESEERSAASLAETYESLANGELEEFRLGLIHGRMPPAEKDAAMDNFRRGEIQVLVCTSVVEVGVDVPNATLMTIESGEWFGLAQLHQLRGRISRGRYPGFCCVFADPQTDDSRKRLDAFTSTTNGFELAEIDFAIRGPGDLFGTQQHGLPPFRIADLSRDHDLLTEARHDAQSLITADPGLAKPEHAKLRKQMVGRYGEALELADVG